MPTTTYTPLANITLSGNTSITISSITAGYRDLVLVLNAEGGNGDFYPRLRFNGDTASNYGWVSARGDGSATSSFQGFTETGLQSTSGTYYSISNRTQTTWNINDFSASNTWKNVLIRSDRANQVSEMLVSTWRSIAAITSIQLFSANGNSITNGTLCIYGIVA
jgi:hypothetical protein